LDTHLEVYELEINKINPAAYNPRTISDSELAALMESLKKFRFVEPLIINKKTNTLVGGHMRLRAAEMLGYKKVPVTYVDLSESEEKALNIALNSHTLAGKFDGEILSGLLDEIKLDLPDIHASLNFSQLEVDLKIDFEPEEEVKPEIKFGEILDEENNYIVLTFKNEIDWLRAVTNFEIDSVDSLKTRSNGKPWSRGIGRVLDGTKFIDRMNDGI
jgi:hypothetical protein